MALLALVAIFPCSLSAQSVTYVYDARDRLVAADYGAGSDLSYVYDPAGNIVTEMNSGPANTLWISIGPEGAGSVSGTGISCPGDCKEPFTGTPQITLTATPQSGFVFLAWGGDWTAFPNTTVLTMDSDRRINAYFGDAGGSTDTDGAPDGAEMGPTGDNPAYDGDDNGVPDYQEARVASLPTFSGGGYATLAVPEGLTLVGVTAVDNPSPGDVLYRRSFPLGLFDFTIQGLNTGGCTTLTLWLTHPAETVDLFAYDMHGPTPGEPSPHWYEFDPEDSSAIRIFPGETATRIELDLCDAQLGDDVLTQDGQVIEVGGPVHFRCLSQPSFDLGGWTVVENQGASACGLLVTWPEGSPYCGTSVVYNLYRSITPGFTPGPSNLLASCLNDAAYLDEDVEFGVEYFYRAQVEDDSREYGGGYFEYGPCYGGNIQTGDNEPSGIATGPEVMLYENDLTTIDDFSIEPGPNDSGTDTWIFPWTPWNNSPPSSVIVFSESTVKDQLLVLTVAQLIPNGGSSFLEFFQNLDTEGGRDGGVLEYTINDGATWFDILDGNGSSIPASPDRFVSNGYNSVLATGNGNPLPGRAAWSNRLYGLVVVDVTDFGGHSVRFRWRFGCDASIAESGWGVDDVVIRHIGACSDSGLIFADGFEDGTTTAWDSP